MSIIDPDAPSENVKNAVIRIKQLNLELYNTINTLHKNIFDQVWHSKDYSSKQIVDAFGTDGRDLFIFSGDIQDLLYDIDSSYKPLIPPKKYTINDDGTVTVEE